MPFEIVVLEKYRRAKALIAARAKIRRWPGLRFCHIEPLAYFVIPPSCGGGSFIYLKLEDNAAGIWGRYDGCAWPFAIEREYATIEFHFDVPVFACMLESVPPG
jgi:hypothetical protein